MTVGQTRIEASHRQSHADLCAYIATALANYAALNGYLPVSGSETQQARLQRSVGGKLFSPTAFTRMAGSFALRDAYGGGADFAATASATRH